MSENMNAAADADSNITPKNRAESLPEVTAHEKVRPSILLALSGLAALIVGGWALTGQDFGELVVSDLLGWVAIAIAIAIGVALVAVPARQNR